jgi:hypothetical protein
MAKPRPRHHAGRQALVGQRDAPCRIPHGRQLCRAVAPAPFAGATTRQPQSAARPGHRQGARAPAECHLALRATKSTADGGVDGSCIVIAAEGSFNCGGKDRKTREKLVTYNFAIARLLELHAERTEGETLLHPRRRVCQRRAARVAGRPLGGLDARARDGDARARCTVRFRHPARPLAASRAPSRPAKRCCPIASATTEVRACCELRGRCRLGRSPHGRVLRSVVFQPAFRQACCPAAPGGSPRAGSCASQPGCRAAGRRG